MFRIRGKYNKTKRDSFITTEAYTTRKEAEKAIKMFAQGRYTNSRVVKIE